MHTILNYTILLTNNYINISKTNPNDQIGHMIKITFPDGSSREYESGVTGLQIADSISKSLAKKAMVVGVDDELWDLDRPIEKDSKVRIVTPDEQECLEIIRHDAAHILAMAAKELFPDLQVTIGPAIKDGFYYDFAKDTPFSTDDLSKLEKKMHEIVKRNVKFEREIWDRDEAVEYFKSIGEFYKAEIIGAIPKGEDVSIYKQGEFMDLCRGPHTPSTAKIKYFKLMKVAGAYWRGDSNNEMLQRIYGTAWATKEQLDNHLLMLEEAEKRDHRKLAKDLDLFHFQEEAQGMAFWHRKGWTIYTILQDYIRSKLKIAGYGEVNTPIKVDRKLWEQSGHWEKFRENMFTVEDNKAGDEEKTYALKPMNCPCHVQIFKQGTKSYRDLPLRMSEFGSCFRNEPSGALHGLMRVRGFVQDDGHIFCTEDQINSETVKFCDLLTEIYKDFGFEKVKVKFSDRPEVRAGTDAVWDQAEAALSSAVKEVGIECEMNPGEGAFYGPKLEFVLTDAIGRDWQCGTIQVDFVLPERLDAEYVAPGGEKKRPVMLHRAIFGSLERFIGILIENYAGKFPLWLAPTQVVVTTITNDFDDYASKVFDKLMQHGIRAEVDLSNEKVNYKIRQHSNLKVPIIAVIGQKEMDDGTLALRFHGSNDKKMMLIDDLIEYIKQENRRYLIR